MGVNKGKVILILLVAFVSAVMYVITDKEISEAIGIWVGENLGAKKIEVTIAPAAPAIKPVVILKVERPELKPTAKFAFHYKLQGKGGITINAETINWSIASMDQTQVTFESDDHLIWAYSRNPFLPPLAAPENLYNKTARLDYLTSSEVFPLTSNDRKVVKIQDRTTADSKPYDWSCLITGQENLTTMAGEFPVEIITCVATGGKTGTETFKYSKAHGHWIARERSGFDQPNLSVELVSYSAE